MDSGAINKLIRSEVWPLLRRFGFTHFETRNAFAYAGHFINVVNFQSFNSYNAEILECTTYSFSVNLGTYVVGRPGERTCKRDKAGRLLPLECECSFRTNLRKRASVDGFARDDIFYIDPDGRTTGACFRELTELVNDSLPRWFEEHNDLESLISGMETAEQSNTSSNLEAEGVRGSYNWNLLQSLLLALKHAEDPSQITADRTVEAIDRMIGTILDFSTIQSGRPGEEKLATDVLEIWDRLGQYRPIPEWATPPAKCATSLESPAWSIASAPIESGIETSDGPTAISARKEFWPVLRNAGFTEFSDRLAHRSSPELIEVVEFLPMDPFERKQWNHPTGLFRIGLGIFWPILRKDGLFRIGKNGDPRPIANECHISNWLIPANPTSGHAGTAFAAAQSAAASLANEGIEWLGQFRNARSALWLFERPNWELFWRYPMMRGCGATKSTSRLVYQALCHLRLAQLNELDRCLQQAESLVHKAFRADLVSIWFNEASARLKT